MVNQNVRFRSQIISGLLIGLYAAIYIGWDMLHTSVHQEVTVIHSDKTEKDSCHRSIFHGESDSHKSHISAFKHCDACQVVSQSVSCHGELTVAKSHPLSAEHNFFLSPDCIPVFISNQSSRAPPFIC